MPTTFLLPWAVACALACSSCRGERAAGDSGPMDASSGIDGARVEDAAFDAGSSDAARDDAGDAGDAGDDADRMTDSGLADAGEGCCSCPDGWRCRPEECICLPPSGCCAGEPCPDGFDCDEGTCGCVFPGSCCEGDACPDGYACNHLCECEHAPCPEPCGPGEVCYFSRCTAACIVDGCPEGERCDAVRGCLPAPCTDEECRAAGMLCDEGSGCFDPCESLAAGCADRGGRCELGLCIDDTCGAVGERCGFQLDCCGRAYCLRASDPEPPCERPCPEGAEPAPRMEECACDVDGICADLRHAGDRFR